MWVGGDPFDRDRQFNILFDVEIESRLNPNIKARYSMSKYNPFANTRNQINGLRNKIFFIK